MSRYCVDIQSDYSNKQLFDYLKDANVPEYVKQAELQDHDAYASLNKEAFADENYRSFPINNPENVYISNAYFRNKEASIKEVWGPAYTNKVKASIEKAAELFGISKDIADYSATTTVKQAADYSESYVFTGSLDSDELNLFPVKTASDVSTAAKTFVSNINKYPFEWRREISKGFVEKSAELGNDDLPELVCKYAGLYYPDSETIQTEIARRVTKMKSAEAIETFATLAKTASEIDSTEDVFKIADIIYFTEKMEGLHQKTAAILGDPVDKLFTLSIEKVASMLDVVYAHDKVYQIKDLQKIGAEIYKQATGIELNPKEASELHDIVPTIPRSDLSLLEELSGLRSL